MHDVEKFKSWLVKQGAIVAPPTNQYEVVRFKAGGVTSVVYTGKRGLTFTGESELAYNLFKNHRTWKVVDIKRRNLRAKKVRLAVRDGKKCFFHGERLGYDELTIEHLVAVSHGGTDHEDNLALACKPCNQELARMAVTQKMLFRDKKLSKSHFDKYIPFDPPPNKPWWKR